MARSFMNERMKVMGFVLILCVLIQGMIAFLTYQGPPQDGNLVLTVSTALKDVSLIAAGFLAGRAAADIKSKEEEK